MERRQTRTEQSTMIMRQPAKLSIKVTNELRRAILNADRVTELLEGTFGDSISPVVLYQGEPYIHPIELSKYLFSKEIVQRDIRIEVPCGEMGAVSIVLFARSWIAMGELDDPFRELLRMKKISIGQIIRDRLLAVEYRHMYYKKVRSLNLAAAFGGEKVQFIQRSRMIFHKKRPIILIHEFVPV